MLTDPEELRAFLREVAAYLAIGEYNLHDGDSAYDLTLDSYTVAI